MSESVLASNPSYKADILDAYSVSFKAYKESVAQFEKEAAKAKEEGKPFNKRRPSKAAPHACRSRARMRQGAG